ncbi:unnamed protein product [Candida verbasci]|uniref:Zn(2)-C6 fungal-type domain-containing protein n=1 Tax=Candida verbasci TaxID=1227364 RepID=A0A9W4TUQ8_9ASCO|nr:unnamed protein product [Candida verbasci]
MDKSEEFENINNSDSTITSDFKSATNNGKKRKYHQKSRNGCSTCKKRRVKCDEQKPKCGNCIKLKLECGYLNPEDENNNEPKTKKSKKKLSLSNESNISDPELSGSITQQATPSLTPSPSEQKTNFNSIASGLLNAGNLNNLNLAHLVNNLSNIGDLSNLVNLGNLASLSNLASLAQMPIDLSDHVGNFTNKNDIPKTTPDISPNNSSNVDNSKLPESNLNMLDLKLMFHYTSVVANTITGAGISDTNIWNHDIPLLAFEHPFLMHSLLAFSATHLSRTEKGLDQCVTCHRGDALRLLREAVLNITSDNTDALVASALILIMDSLANASFPSSTSPKSLPASAWIFHVKGAATILTAVWPLTEASRFYKFISVDLGDLGDIINNKVYNTTPTNEETSKMFTDLECHDAEIADLFPVEMNSPYLITLAYLNKLHKERYKSDFILRIFAFPALLDKNFMSLLMSGDIKAMRIMRSYYKLLRSFTMEMKDKVWFLEGVSQVLPQNVEEYAGGAGGMHMMMDFLGGGPAIIDDDDDDVDDLTNNNSNTNNENNTTNEHNDIDEEELNKFDTSKLIDTNNLPSDITIDIMGDGFINIK